MKMHYCYENGIDYDTFLNRKCMELQGKKDLIHMEESKEYTTFITYELNFCIYMLPLIIKNDLK